MEGDAISLDGISGEVYRGEVEVTFEKPVELLKWWMYRNEKQLLEEKFCFS